MNILITGATGFIGHHLVKKLRDDGHRTFITLRPNSKNVFSSFEAEPFVLSGNYFEGLIDFITLNSIEGIIHLASLVQSGDHKPGEVEDLINANVEFPAIMLEAACITKVKWFINTGTYWQYYNKKDYSPVNLYAATKQAFFDIAKYYWETDRIRFSTVMVFDTYGPEDTRPKIFNLWQRIAKSGELLEMSKGEQLLDISHVYDVVNAFVLLARHLHNNLPDVGRGEIFTVKADKRYSVRNLAEIYEKATSSKLNIIWGGRPYKEREIMIPYQGGRSVPGWKSEINIEEGIRSLYSNES
ncbi:MAG: NAD(P)-dependent oxidoreductase [Niabella sp.]